jgi:RNA polymerase sigma-70 factor (ECF subfamily)
VQLFDAEFSRLFRFLDRLSGDPDVAADLAQDTFVRLYQRGTMPDAPAAWLITVAMNLFRNERTKGRRRRHLLTATRATFAHSDPAPHAGRGVEAAETRAKVRTTIDQLPGRERRLLLLSAEGYSYRDIASALELNEASVGTLLARARDAFRAIYGDA